MGSELGPVQRFIYNHFHILCEALEHLEDGRIIKAHEVLTSLKTDMSGIINGDYL